MAIEINKVEQEAPIGFIQETFVQKVEEKITDDYGNEVILYRKRFINTTSLDAEIASLEKTLTEKKAVKAEIVKIK